MRRAGRRLRPVLVPVVLAAVTVVAGADAAVQARPRTPSAAAPHPVRLVIPVLSLRREPAAISRLIAQSHLQDGLDVALARWPSSCLLVRRGRQLLFSLRPDLMLLPASNLKLLTATAVLAKLRGSETFTTEARMAGGTLWLVGGGDPVLDTGEFVDFARRQSPERLELAHPVYTPLEQLADAVRAAGVTSVPAGIMGDESRLDSQRYLPTWRPRYITDGEIGPMSALDVNNGFVAFRPLLVPAPAPAKHAADAMAALLQARGVAVTGGTGTGTAPPGRTVARIQSPTVDALVGEMLMESDNLTAELLTKELGRRFGGAGTTAAGVGVIRATLAARGLAVRQLAAVDGSGLDRSDRASCALLLAALEEAGPTGPLAAGLPVAGREGTLADRFVGHPAAGRLRAKTGTLDGVSSLTGFVDELAGPPLAFSLVVNGLPAPEATGRAVQAQIGAVLARYPDAPSPEDLAP